MHNVYSGIFRRHRMREREELPRIVNGFKHYRVAWSSVYFIDVDFLCIWLRWEHRRANYWHTVTNQLMAQMQTLSGFINCGKQDRDIIQKKVRVRQWTHNMNWTRQNHKTRKAERQIVCNRLEINDTDCILWNKCVSWEFLYTLSVLWRSRFVSLIIWSVWMGASQSAP